MAAIGIGGMGEVYRAHDSRLERHVALKVVRHAGSAAQVQRLEREARAAGALNHPNIVAVYDVGTADGSPYVVSELLEGDTLRHRLSMPIPLAKAVDWAAQVARGLAAAHEKGIAHRDIKPENLFITRAGTVKILDFGLAKRDAVSLDEAVTSPQDEHLTASGMVVGTTGYMSPEQALGRPSDHRSDIFSLGVVLYEMLAGQKPFRGGSPVDTLHAIVHDDPPDLLKADPRLPAALVRIVQHCLEKAPEHRFQSASDLAFSLQEILDPTAGPAPRTRTEPWRRWQGVGVAVLGVMAGIAVAALSRPKVNVPRFEQVTFRRGTVHAARFGPDGKTVMYSAAWDGAPPEVWLTLPGSSESRPWGGAGASFVAVSPAGELALISRRRLVGAELALGTLARATFTGGAAREVLEDVQEADWAPDGRAMAVLRAVGSATLSRLEYPVGRVLLEGNHAFHHMRVSPDGETVALFADPGGIGYGGAVTVVSRSGAQRQITRNWPNARGLAWSPSGREIWFTAAEEHGQRELRAVSLSGVERLITSAPGSLTLRDVSPSGRVLLTQDAERRGVIAQAPAAAAEKEYTWLDRSAMGDLAADGRTLLFADRFRVYTRRTDGAPAVQIGEGHADALSSDGRWALATTVAGDGLVILPTGAGEPRPVPRHSITSYAGAHWLPDGERVLFNGRERGQGVRIYVQKLDGTAPRPITPEGTRTTGAVTLDGRSVAAVAADGTTWVYPIDGGEPRRALGCQPGERPATWNVEGTALWVYRRDQLPARVFRVDVATGQRELWRTFMPSDAAGLVSITKVDLTPDARAYAYSYRRILSDLYVVDGLR